MRSALFGKILKFGVTGGLGTVTNLVLFHIFADVLGFQQNAVSAGCFVISCTQNYVLNHLWTFRAENAGARLSVRLWAKFVAASLVGFAVNQAVLTLLCRASAWQFTVLGEERSLKVIPQGIGILCGMVLNFTFSALFVFKKKGADDSESADSEPSSE